jgi:alpha-glucosidase
LLTLPGVAVTYNGEEIGMLDYREISWSDTQDPAACNTHDPEHYQLTTRDPVRTPFQWDSSVYAGFKGAEGAKPWLPVHTNYKTINLALQKEAPKSTYKMYQQLAVLRRNDTFVYGDFKSSVVGDEVFGYVRSLEGQVTYVILINFSDKPTVVDVNSAVGVNFKDKSQIVLAGSLSSYNVG